MVSSVLNKALTALDRLEGIVHADPRGHASLQPRGRVGATANPFPAGEAPSHPTRAILSPRPGPDPEAVTPLEVVGWHLQLTQEEARAVPGTWVPLDQSVLALLEVDYLGQWSHLLIEVSKWGCPQYGPGSTPPPFGTGGLPRVLVACEQSQV